MGESVVVVFGSDASPVGAEPFYFSAAPKDIPEAEHAISVQEYGNHLPLLWDLTKQLALVDCQQKSNGLERVPNKDWKIVTNSIDGRAPQMGFEKVVEVWGNVFEAKCLRCQHVTPVTVEEYQKLDGVVLCEQCGKDRVRPNVMLRGERMFGRRCIESLMKDSTRCVFVGVDPNNADIEKWKSLACNTILISPEPWGTFDNFYTMTTDEWLDEGCPI